MLVHTCCVDEVVIFLSALKAVNLFSPALEPTKLNVYFGYVASGNTKWIVVILFRWLSRFFFYSNTSKQTQLSPQTLVHSTIQPSSIYSKTCYVKRVIKGCHNTLSSDCISLTLCSTNVCKIYTNSTATPQTLSCLWFFSLELNQDILFSSLFFYFSVYVNYRFSIHTIQLLHVRTQTHSHTQYHKHFHTRYACSGGRFNGRMTSLYPVCIWRPVIKTLNL